MTTKGELSKKLIEHVKACKKCRVYDYWHIDLCKMADEMQQKELKEAILWEP